jgi:diacylglycerol kinase family enzyme
MPRAVLIANPSASQFTGGGYRRIKAILEQVYELTTEWPIGPHETERLAGEAAVRGVDVVFAMGGDGVAHHVANGLVHSDTALGLIPVGTTNVLSRIFDIPQKPVKAAELATEWQPVPTRTVRIDAETDTGVVERHATFSVGFGFDADVVEAAEARPFAKTRFGSVHYATTAITRLLSNWRTEPANLRVVCDGDRFDAVAALTQVHHPFTYLGPVPLHLTPEPPDGVATLAGSSLGILRSLEIFSRATLGARQRDATGVRLWVGYEELSIDADPASPFQADGELLGHARRAVLTPDEGALMVLRPEE